jgi:rhodanese-related sulfurtransferase
VVLPTELNEKLEHFQLLDAREADEWRAGRIDGSLHIPLARLPSRVGELDRTKPVAAICRSGRRSGEAAVWLRSRGFEVVNLAGGLTAWLRSGLPLVGDEGSPRVA